MNWRNMQPRREDYETKEEYDDALDEYYDAQAWEYEERKYHDEEY